MSLKKILLFVLVLQIPAATLPQAPQNKNPEDKQGESVQQYEVDPGLSLLLSAAGATLGGFVIFLGAFATLGGVLINMESSQGDFREAKIVGGGALGLAGLGITYVGAKMTWFYLKRGGKVLFHKEPSSEKKA